MLFDTFAVLAALSPQSSWHGLCNSPSSSPLVDGLSFFHLLWRGPATVHHLGAPLPLMCRSPGGPSHLMLHAPLVRGGFSPLSIYSPTPTPIPSPICTPGSALTACMPQMAPSSLGTTT
ncbi:hypothetical protein GOP47_0028695 [Adiantum capillus-veneris]|nr:hypothetical protein GOP47_0028695 [Adiantum capillus-veneris]